MRVITGTARGRRLLTLEGEDVTRPTSEKVKEALFSMIQFDIEGRRVLDLFSGSGQLGIEALSRGAEKCFFIDSNKSAIEIIRKNVNNCGFSYSSDIRCVDANVFLSGTKERFDIALLDPPYKSGLLLRALEKVTDCMSDYGIIVCEHSADEQLPEKLSDFTLVRTRTYGKTIAVSLYRKGAEQ